MKKSILYLVLISSLFTSCKKESVNCDVSCTYDEELIFQTGFNNTTLENDDYMNTHPKGTDLSLTNMNSWADFNSHPNIGEVKINYEEGEESQRIASIVNDPDSLGNKALQFQIFQPHIKEGSKYKGRVQMDMYNNQCLKEIYQTVRVRFHPDMAYLMQWEERAPWLSIFEFWNNADWNKEKYPFRVTVNLFKDAEGPVDAMHFHVKGDYKNNCKTCSWKKSWEEEATNFAIPFGEWMEIELYLKEGDENNGQFYMAVTPDGGDKVELFNITNNTQHPKEKCPDGFTHFQPMKFYTSDKLINYMRDGDKNLSLMWDDWKFYKNKSF